MTHAWIGILEQAIIFLGDIREAIFEREDVPNFPSVTVEEIRPFLRFRKDFRQFCEYKEQFFLV